MAAPFQIRHVSYDDFFRLKSAGVDNLRDFRAHLDELIAEIGDPRHHNLVIDLKDACIGPLPAVLLVQAMTHLAERELGRTNKG